MRPVTVFLQHHHGLDLKELNSNVGMKWVDWKELSDLNFADDIVLPHHSWAGMQAMT